MLTRISPMPQAAHEDLGQLLARIRPRLHRYCARMAGSALDGEDIVQEALTKAALHYDPAAVQRSEAWMFRVAHNATLDFLRRRALERELFAAGDDVDDAPAEQTTDPLALAEATTAALGTFMLLPPTQRSAVILADVLEHTLQEIAELHDASVAAVKASLHRGRAKLRQLARQPLEAAAPVLTEEDWALAQLYARRFNARDFDGLRALLAEEVRLDLASRLSLKGKGDVAVYFGNYAQLDGLRAVPSAIEDRCGLWIHEPLNVQPYAIVLEWRGGQLAVIRDFRYARYVTELLQ
jgi:RNA polymerase sigma-70 factor (ECF subfamily)